MSEPENFLDRWSRRKRDGAAESVPAEAKQPEAAPLPSEVEKPAAKATFDPATLPPIESIMAESDIRAFLQPGVPPELSRAALRRAWFSDPAIRDFVGLVENGWDFNDPDAVPGFGRIAANDVVRLLTQAMGAPEPDVPAAGPVSEKNDGSTERPNPDAGPADAPTSEEASATVQRNIENNAPQHKDQG